MQKYRRRLPKPLAVDTAQMRAAVNLVLAVEDEQPPDAGTLRTLHDAFLEIFGGRNPEELFGAPLGLVAVKGRPRDYGFTAGDIVSAYIELRRRELQTTNSTNALQTAKDEAAKVFIDFDGTQDPERAVDRDWAAGRSTVENLSSHELEAIIAPYAQPDR